MKIVQGLFLLALTAVLSFVALLGSSALQWAQDLPSLDQVDALEYTSNTEVYASDGTRIGTIVPAVGKNKEPTNRIPVTLDQVSPAALEAIVASEDDQFFRHYGFDLPGIAKATYQEFFGNSNRGGSTITTQVIKNTVLQNIAGERSLERKAKEIMLAIELERRLTKPEILQRYINVVFWGGNVYGIRAASQAYFGKDPIELNLAEGLYLARLIPAPNAIHSDFKDARQGMKDVLAKMVRRGTITRETADRAWHYKLEPRGWNVTYDDKGDVVKAERTGENAVVQSSISSDLSRGLVLAVRNWLTQRYGENMVFGRGGLKVYTTIDVQAQKAANEASRTTEVPPGAQMAVVGIDPKSGGVLAMVGQKLGPDQPPQEFNRAIQAYRQPGSSFKPIVYGTGIEQGGLNQASILVDDKTVFKVKGQADYQPKEWDNAYDGYQTARENLDRSRNIPAVKALEAATPEAVAEKARELGYNVKPYLGMALGSFEVTPLQHAAALAAFANGGVYTVPYFVEKVEDAQGNVIYTAHPRRSRVWSPQTAYIMLDMMHGNIVDRKPYWALSWRAEVPGHWLAGKTGTTDSERDIWFVGLTPGLVGAVWIGNDDNKPMPRNMTYADGHTGIVTSSQQPIYAFNTFAQGALRGHSADPNGFPVPNGITFHNIDLKTGALDPNGTRVAFKTATDLSAQGFLPTVKLQLPIDKRTGKRATVQTPLDQIEIKEVDPKNVDQYLPPGTTLPQVSPPSGFGVDSGSGGSGSGAGGSAGTTSTGAGGAGSGDGVGTSGSGAPAP
ncbi:MAG TPA: transglycosylase domain-containing protein [Trueperaceae bacterium]|nr:transglycosylase domain-containing protein [Trueperaceae bacterium]